MNQIPVTKETKEIAKRIVWFEKPSQSLKDTVRFMAYAMRYAQHSDMSVLREYISDNDFIYILENAPSGIIDERSWAYWNAVFGKYPTPPLPKRKLG